MKKVLLTLSLVVLMLMMSFTAVAGSIYGNIYEPGWEKYDGGFKGKCVGSATVRIVSPRHSDETTSGSSGFYCFEDVPFGLYIVSAEHPGYLTLFRGITITLIWPLHTHGSVALWLFPK